MVIARVEEVALGHKWTPNVEGFKIVLVDRSFFDFAPKATQDKKKNPRSQNQIKKHKTNRNRKRVREGAVENGNGVAGVQLWLDEVEERFKGSMNWHRSRHRYG